LSLAYYQETASSLKCVSKRWISFTLCKIQKNFLFYWTSSKLQVGS